MRSMWKYESIILPNLMGKAGAGQKAYTEWNANEWAGVREVLKERVRQLHEDELAGIVKRLGLSNDHMVKTRLCTAIDKVFTLQWLKANAIVLDCSDEGYESHRAVSHGDLLVHGYILDFCLIAAAADNGAGFLNSIPTTFGGVPIATVPAYGIPHAEVRAECWCSRS